jgi:hypothetical protein
MLRGDSKAPPSYHSMAVGRSFRESAGKPMVLDIIALIASCVRCAVAYVFVIYAIKGSSRGGAGNPARYETETGSS